MGCIFPKPTLLDDEWTSSNLFDVINVDHDGNENLAGQIEITDEYLLLHQNRILTTSWPIRTLRRYGFKDNVFSFEAGRRCLTGEGVYTFKCEKADELFALMQANIQRTCANSSVVHDSETGNNYLEPRAVGVRHFRLESSGSTSSCPHTPVSPVAPSLPSPHLDLISENEVDSNIIDTNSNVDNRDVSPSELNNIGFNNENGIDNNRPLYINVSTANDNLDEGTHHSYMNVGKHQKRCLSPLSLPPMDENEGLMFTERSPENVEYVVLKLENNGSSNVIRSSTRSDRLPKGYTTIDFKRTWALIQTAKPNVANDVGCKRRTRHNSSVVTPPL